MVKADNFDCVDIKCDANFTLDEAIKTANGTVFTTMAGRISGENKIFIEINIMVKEKVAAHINSSSLYLLFSFAFVGSQTLQSVQNE